MLGYKNRVVLLLLVAMLLSLPCLGQNITGEITGIVKDASGGVIPGVEVRATNAGTGAANTSITNDLGVYTIRALPIGTYSVTAEVAGFKKFEMTGIRLQVNEAARVDIVLQVGQMTETVQVEASVVNVDTQTPTLKTVIDQRRVEDLPLNGRDPVQLMRLVAGVAVYAGSGLTSDTTYPGVVSVTVNGSRGNATNFVLDGGQNNDHYSNAPNPMPNPDALAEFSVQTNNFSAEFGRNLGGVVNAVTKSGTNELHGSAFGYLRNSVFNAANFFTTYKADGSKQDDGLKRSQFGATLGGPVWLGKLYDGHGKTFFFFSYQGTRLRRIPTTTNVNTFTAAERQGDFSATTTKALKDPFTGANYPNNKIPQSEWSAPAKYILDNYLPVPASGRLISYQRIQNYNDDQYMIKGDHNLTSRNQLSGRFYISNASQPADFDPKNLYKQVKNMTWRNTSVIARDTHTFGPSLINQANFSYNRTNNFNLPTSPDKNYNDIGMKGITQDPHPQYYFTIQGLSGIDSGDTNGFLREEYQAADTLRWTKGRHQLSIGVEAGYGVGDIINNYYGNGRFSFTDSAGFTGNAIADFLIGKYAYMEQGKGEFKNTRFKILNMFITDSMKISRRLTVDLGVRWEPFFPYYDSLGKLAVWKPGQQSTRFVKAPKGVVYPGDSGVPKGGVNTGWLNFAPRVGMALDLTGDGKTSLRLGYGIFYDRSNTISTNSQANQGPFGTRVGYYGNQYNGLSDPWGGYVGGNPLPVTGFNAVGTSALNPGPDATFIFPHIAFIYASDFRTANTQAWNLTLEREVVKNLIARISYAGSKGTALVSDRDINAPLPDAKATTATTDVRRPMYPNYGLVTLVEGVGNSNYHSFQLTAERRFAQGFSILANYTFSKTIDNNQGSANKGTGVSVTNPLDQNYDRGRADFDRTHVFNFSSVWAIPGTYGNTVSNLLLGGWNLTTIVALYSGNVFTVASGVDNARTGQGGQRADVVGNPYSLGDNRSRGDRILQYFNKAAWTQNALGTYGLQGRNWYRGPGRANVDLGIHKKFKIRERITSEFRFEMFNAFNRVNLSNPNTTVTSTNFMRITGAGDPRILQFALRFVW